MAGSDEGVLAQALDAAPGVHLARRCADLGEALAVAEAGRADVAVLSLQPHLDGVTVAEFVAMGVAVIGVGRSPVETRALAGFGVEVVVDAREVAALVAAVAGAKATPVARELSPPPRVAGGALVAVWGPTGAPGRTSVAVNLSAALAPEGVLLIDADTYGGAVAQALGLADETPGIAGAARDATRGAPSGDAIVRYASAALPGLRVLTGLPRASRWPELAAASLDRLWDLARAESALTVVDCGFCLEQDEDLAYDTRAPRRNAATLSALAAADVVVVVGSSEPLGIQRLVHALSDLADAAESAAATPVVVVNRVRAAVVGNNPDRQVADALARFASTPEVWTVPWDPRTADAATLRGATWRECAPRGPGTRAMDALAAHVLALCGASARARVAAGAQRAPVPD